MKKQHALCESATGTGKTLCLLCAVLGWRAHYKKKMGLKSAERTIEDILLKGNNVCGV
jgi:Rad3-related DNA helicase